MKKLLIALEIFCLSALTLCVACVAGEAVSKANGKVDLFGGRVDGNDTGNISGSYAFPLTSYFGAQVDGLYGKLDNEHLYGGGGKSLMRRHREDDPLNHIIFSISSSIAPSFNPSLFGSSFIEHDATPL